MPVLGLRYASAFQHACNPDTFGISPFTQPGLLIGSSLGSIGGTTTEGGRVYACPAAYSEVRRVVFWASFRQEHTGSPLSGVRVRLRVAPSSTSAIARAIDTAVFPSGSIRRTNGAGSVWASTPSAEGAFYAASPSQNNDIEVEQFNLFDIAGAQMVYQEFNRFAANSTDFFNDWDTIAANGDLDEHLAFWLGIERIDGQPWTASGTANDDNRPIITACGFSIVQAPTAVNRTRLYLPIGPPLFNPGAIGAVFAQIRATSFFYNASDYDGDLELRIVSRQHPSSAVGDRGNWTIQVFDQPNQTVDVNVRHTEQFNDEDSGLLTFLGRSSEFLSSIQDGDALTIHQMSNTGANQDVPWNWVELTHHDFNRTRVFFSVGHCPWNASTIPDGAPPPDTWGKGESLFDSDWFQAFPDDRILARNVWGGLRHVSGSNQSAERVELNARLEDNVALSLFNAEVPPEVSSTPDATIGAKYQTGPILNNDPIDLAGRRKLVWQALGTSWISAGSEVPGSVGLSYLLNVPNSEFPELGPIFDLGAFSPEGCASTSAGLGEPGILIITNGSVIPKKFNPAAFGTSAEIEDAGVPTPFDGEIPSFIVDDAAASPDGGLSIGMYIYRYTLRNCCTGKESDPNPDDIEVDTAGASPAAEVTLNFSGVRIPGDDQVCEICVYRSIIGGAFPVLAKVGCFDPSETSVFVDTTGDSLLDFTTDGLSIFNAPMPCVPIVVDFRNRLWGMGDIPNLAPAGTVSVVNGSDLVIGDSQVEWDRCLEGKFIQFEGDCHAYEILRVMPPESGFSPPISRLRLTEEYGGTTDNNLSYTICGRPNRLYFSEPLEPEFWPLPNFIDVEPGDGDRLMGAVSNFDRLVICKRRKTYVLTFREQPAIEVIVPSRISSDIGCIAPRSFAQIETGSVWLADRGLALFDGRTVQHVPESDAMNSLFVDEDNPLYIRRDRNGRVIDAVGVFYPKRQQYLLLLPTVQTERGSNVLLVWDVKLRNITLLSFCQEFQSMVVGKDAEGNERVYLGDTNGFVWIYDVGDTDGVGFPNSTGTVRGTVNGVGIDDLGASFLDDAQALFITGGLPGLAGLSGLPGLSGALDGDDLGLAGACVFTRAAGAELDEEWTKRTVYAATENRLYVTPPWESEQPAIGDEYMLGPIELRCVFKPQNYGTDDFSKRNWSQILVHEPEQFASRLRVELLPDFQLSDPEELTVVSPETGQTGAGRIFLMDYPRGRQTAPVGREVHNFEAVRLSNFAPEEPVRIINYLLRVEARMSR